MGEIVGTGTDANGDQQPLVWASGSATPTVLAAPAGYTGVYPNGVSRRRGEIVGSGLDASDDQQSLAWASGSATPTVLTTPAGYSDGYPTGVSSSGEIVGYGKVGNSGFSVEWASESATPSELSIAESFPPDIVAVTPQHTMLGMFDHRPYWWASPTATPTALATPTGYLDVNPVGVSSSGQIVGIGDDANGDSQGLFWASPTATPTVLAAPSGYTEVYPFGVSSSGLVVGIGTDASSDQQPLAWASPTAGPRCSLPRRVTPSSIRLGCRRRG